MEKTEKNIGGRGFDIIPAIDIIDGKCVRLSQGDYDRKVIYNEDPLEVAKTFEGIGIRRLHLVDLDGAKAGRVMNYDVLEKIASNTGLIIDFGGGVKSDEVIRKVFDAGASMATIGSVAVNDQELFISWLKKYGTGKILLGGDVRNDKVSVSGWTKTTGIGILDFIRMNMNLGVEQLFCTDIAMDGLLKGPSVDLYRRILAAFPRIGLIASGGVSCKRDLDELKDIGCSGVIIGKAIYENRITLDELKKFL